MKCPRVVDYDLDQFSAAIVAAMRLCGVLEPIDLGTSADEMIELAFEIAGGQRFVRISVRIVEGLD